MLVKTLHFILRTKQSLIGPTRRLVLAFLVALATPAVAQEPFSCDGFPVVVQNQNAQLLGVAYQVPGPTLWSNLGQPADFEINAMGFGTDNFLYGVRLLPSGNDGIVQIDRTGAAVWLGQPADLPTDVRLDAGDIARDINGDKMYLNLAGLSPLYIVDLNTMTTTSPPLDLTGARGFVHDWAVNPEDGLLYGGDSSHGQLAVLDPVSGHRVDYSVQSNVPGLSGFPRGVAYGGAWFDGAGFLHLHRNDGAIYKLGNVTGPNPTVEDAEAAVAAMRNDGASCLGASQSYRLAGLSQSYTLTRPFYTFSRTFCCDGCSSDEGCPGNLSCTDCQEQDGPSSCASDISVACLDDLFMCPGICT